MSALFFSCKKEAKTTNTEFLTKTCWKYSSKVVDNTNDGIDNGAEQILACDQDNTECFNVNGTGNIDFGTQLCGTEANTATTWSWSNSSQTQMNYQQGSGALPIVINVMQLDATTFKYNIVLDFTSSGGSFTKITATAIHL